MIFKRPGKEQDLNYNYYTQKEIESISSHAKSIVLSSKVKPINKFSFITQSKMNITDIGELVLVKPYVFAKKRI